MLTKPMRPCGHPGCGVVVADGNRCPAHARVQRAEREARERQRQALLDERRESASKRGYGRAWQKAREGFLANHPVCVHCLKRGVATQATEVDHIVPHRRDRELFWDRENWQALCKPCHARKTAAEVGFNGRGS